MPPGKGFVAVLERYGSTSVAWCGGGFFRACEDFGGRMFDY